MTPIRIVIVDDHRVVSESLKSYLDASRSSTSSRRPPVERYCFAASGTGHRSSSFRTCYCPVGWMASRPFDAFSVKPHGCVSLHSLPRPTRRGWSVPCARGASGYVRKDADPEVLLAAIRAAAAGRTYLDPSVAPQVLALAEAPGDLTERELQVLRQLTLGQSNKEIAAVLSVTEETVKTHVALVLMKLQVDNRSQAVTQALELGLVSLDD
jgi:DNA-binding NarL/FixJ family response regulator